MRIVGYIGIALLLIIVGIGLLISIDKKDWYGLIVMLGFGGILVFFAHGLRAAAKRESNPEGAAESNLGWCGVPLSEFIRGPLLHTPEGIIVILGGATSCLFALLAGFAPAWIGLAPERSASNATLFGLWPILLFVLYVKWSAPHFQPSIYTRIVLLIWAGIPIYLAYR
jgi:hypothetical protein